MNLINLLRERGAFLQEFLRNFQDVGALFPTSAAAATALGSYAARLQAPRRILEVGAGTGAITAQLVKELRPGDHYVICEINPTFAAYLRQRLAREPEFQRVSHYCQVYEGSVLELSTSEQFDFIISTLPFNNCSLAFVTAVLDHYRALLKPGGILSYIEYIGGRTLKQAMGGTPDAQQVQTLLAAQRARHEIGRDVVFRNAPPAWIHHLRFSEADTQQAQALVAYPNQQVRMGAMTFDADLLPFVGGLAGLAFALRKVWPTSKIWQVPTALIPLVALFLRDPPRQVFNDLNTAYAASDGTVLAIERLSDSRFGEQEWLRIVVFLSILDVHVNRAPIAGKVMQVVQEAGGYAAANSSAAEHNLAQYTVIEGIYGRCIVAQRAGLIARRIVNRTRVGNLLAQGEKFGLIRFGSRTDVYLPAAQAEPLVTVGQQVRGGETALARFLPRQA
jgi:phosphatidylserine decarboxylase